MSQPKRFKIQTQLVSSDAGRVVTAGWIDKLLRGLSHPIEQVGERELGHILNRDLESGAVKMLDGGAWKQRGPVSLRSDFMRDPHFGEQFARYREAYPSLPHTPEAFESHLSGLSQADRETIGLDKLPPRPTGYPTENYDPMLEGMGKSWNRSPKARPGMLPAVQDFGGSAGALSRVNYDDAAYNMVNTVKKRAGFNSLQSFTRNFTSPSELFSQLYNSLSKFGVNPNQILEARVRGLKTLSIDKVTGQHNWVDTTMPFKEFATMVHDDSARFAKEFTVTDQKACTESIAQAMDNFGKLARQDKVFANIFKYTRAFVYALVGVAVGMTALNLISGVKPPEATTQQQIIGGSDPYRSHFDTPSTSGPSAAPGSSPVPSTAPSGSSAAPSYGGYNNGFGNLGPDANPQGSDLYDKVKQNDSMYSGGAAAGKQYRYAQAVPNLPTPPDFGKILTIVQRLYQIGNGSPESIHQIMEVLTKAEQEATTFLQQAKSLEQQGLRSEARPGGDKDKPVVPQPASAPPTPAAAPMPNEGM